MNLDQMKSLGIVVGRIVDSELGDKFVACVGKETAGGISCEVGRYCYMGDTALQAAQCCYDDLGLEWKAPDPAEDALPK
jgi:hypothetical protein